MKNRKEFIKTILKVPRIKREYDKQAGYYQEYIGDDWEDYMFRYDKEFFYIWLGEIVLNSLIKEKGDVTKNIIDQDEDFFENFSKEIKEII